MGYITSEYKVGYVVAPEPYVCMGSRLEISRNLYENEGKYRVMCMFNIHYSFPERQSNPNGSIIDTKFYSEIMNSIPENLIAIMYEKVKSELLVVQDNL